MKQSRWDLIALVLITITGLICHLGWARASQAVIFGTTIAVTILLAFAAAWLWRRFSLWLTKFFCIAAIIDLAAEGFLRPYHGDTVTTKLICQMTLFAAYAVYLVALRPVDVWIGRHASWSLRRQ